MRFFFVCSVYRLILEIPRFCIHFGRNSCISVCKASKLGNFFQANSKFLTKKGIRVWCCSCKKMNSHLSLVYFFRGNIFNCSVFHDWGAALPYVCASVNSCIVSGFSLSRKGTSLIFVSYFLPLMTQPGLESSHHLRLLPPLPQIYRDASWVPSSWLPAALCVQTQLWALTSRS